MPEQARALLDVNMPWPWLAGCTCAKVGKRLASCMSAGGLFAVLMHLALISRTYPGGYQPRVKLFSKSRFAGEEAAVA